MSGAPFAQMVTADNVYPYPLATWDEWFRIEEVICAGLNLSCLRVAEADSGCNCMFANNLGMWPLRVEADDYSGRQTDGHTNGYMVVGSCSYEHTNRSQWVQTCRNRILSGWKWAHQGQSRAPTVGMKVCVSVSMLVCVCLAVLGFQISSRKHDAPPPGVHRLPYATANPLKPTASALTCYLLSPTKRHHGAGETWTGTTVKSVQ